MSHLPFSVGRATLVGGEVIVADSSLLATSKVLATNDGNAGTIGTVSVRISAGSSFTINSSSATDTSVISYLIIY